VTNDSALTREIVAAGKSASCPIIDTHAHYGPYQGIYFPQVTAAQMVETMDRCGVRITISAGHTALVDPDRGNAEMAQVLQEFPDRFRAYWGINPNYPEHIAPDLAQFENRTGFVGFKFLSDYHKVPITDERYAPVLEYANERALPILMHTWGGSAFDSPAHVAKLAPKYPGATFLMGHSGHGAWQEAMQVAGQHDNVILELCAAYSVRGVIEAFVEKVGSEKITFGTDLPWFDPHYGIGCVLFARIGDEDRHNILHRNAERIFGL